MDLNTNDRGLRVLYPVGSNKDVKIHADLVFLHGLNGCPRRTWVDEKSGSYWPLHFLPQDIPSRIPNVRIMTLGYGAKAGVFANSYASFREYAVELLGKMTDLRQSREEEGRPILWICHSFGGIVVKQALVQAKLQERYNAIQKSTIGIIFFGTPHRGSEVANYVDRLTSLFTLLLHTPEAKLLQHLRSNSPELTNLSEDARHVLSGVEILSFVEMKPMSGMKEPIVSAYSAKLDIANEEIIPVEADHRSICRFASPKDSTYKTVVRKIRTIIDNARIVAVAIETEQYQRELTEIAKQIDKIKTMMQEEAADIIETLGFSSLGPVLQEGRPIPPSRTQESAILAGRLVSDAKILALQIQGIVNQKRVLEEDLRNLRKKYESILQLQNETLTRLGGLKRENGDLGSARNQSDMQSSELQDKTLIFRRERDDSERLLGKIGEASQTSIVVDQTIEDMTALVRAEMGFLDRWVQKFLTAGLNADRRFWIDFVGDFIPFIRSLPGDLEPAIKAILDSYQSQDRRHRHEKKSESGSGAREGELELRLGPINIGSLGWRY